MYRGMWKKYDYLLLDILQKYYKNMCKIFINFSPTKVDIL